MIFLAPQPNAVSGLVFHKVIVNTYNDAPKSVGLLWTSEQLDAKTSI
jgi:hypothetical protein